MTSIDAETRLLGRARDLLSRPEAWLEQDGDRYALRATPHRRRRPLLRLDEAAFLALIVEPGLRPRAVGGWRLVETQAGSLPPPPPGRPGVVEGERVVADPDGTLRRQRANLGESPIAWLARRKGPDGKPWLTAQEAAAGERLRYDVHRAGQIGRQTMDWSALGGSGARGSSAPSARLDPLERGVAARRRVHAAMEAVGADFAAILQRVCIVGSALEAAERDLGLPRRAGKTVLKMALARLAQHYRMG